jgi:hypothetical protein
MYPSESEGRHKLSFCLNFIYELNHKYQFNSPANNKETAQNNNNNNNNNMYL